MKSEIKNILSVSPIDGRYSSITESLSNYFSEYALIKYRVYIEIEYFIELTEIPLKNLKDISTKNKEDIRMIYKNFSVENALQVKEIEKKINHDVKAIEYFIKKEFEKINLGNFKEFIHFGLTSQDINNTAVPLMLKDGLKDILNKVKKSDLVIISMLIRIKMDKGISTIDDTHNKLINKISKLKKPIIGISFGSPYLPSYDKLDSYICTYGYGSITFKAATSAIFGKINITTLGLMFLGKR